MDTLASPASVAPSIRERLKAGGTHLAFSAFLLLVALFLVYVLWYPAPLDKASGVNSKFLVLLCVDVVVGPLLTTIVYKHNRRLFLLDMTIILSIQLSAYLYGVHAMAEGRPVWLGFVVDDVEVVRAVDIDQRQREHFKPEYRASLWHGPRWAAALYSDDPKVREQEKEDEIFEGISLAYRPETYAPLSVRKTQILARQHTLDELTKYNPPDRVKVELTRCPGTAGWLPLKAPELEMVVLLNKNAEVCAIADLRPW